MPIDSRSGQLGPLPGIRTEDRLSHWLQGLGTSPLNIEPGSLWENGYCESFNGKLREECLNGEICYSLKEARIVIEQWRW